MCTSILTDPVVLVPPSIFIVEGYGARIILNPFSELIWHILNAVFTLLGTLVFGCMFFSHTNDYGLI